MSDDAPPPPSLQAVDFAARAEQRGAASDSTISEIRRAVFDEGVEAPALARKYKDIAFPLSTQERSERTRQQITSAGRRLATLVADPSAQVPAAVASAVEESVGRLLDSLEN